MIDTSGNKMPRVVSFCRCGLTAGCPLCNPNLYQNYNPRLQDGNYGREELDKWINEKARNVPSIEKIREITAKLPSLTKMLLDDRGKERIK